MRHKPLIPLFRIRTGFNTREGSRLIARRILENARRGTDGVRESSVAAGVLEESDVSSLDAATDSSTSSPLLLSPEPAGTRSPAAPGWLSPCA